jgi:glycosyltransferase involved in cell wall biosynthesis
MRMLLVHNSYQQRGGEDAVVDAERALLAGRGHEVETWFESNDVIRSARSKLEHALRLPHCSETRQRMSQKLAAFRPDIVHVHNTFPRLTSSIYESCNEAGVPVVQTLHNYRPICAGAMLLRGGKICEECLTRSPYHAVRHRCYRGSLTGTAAVARMIDRNIADRVWTHRIDRFVALTDFAKAKFVQAGFPAARISVKPNFVFDERGAPRAGGERRGALFVGRLSPEKGVLPLLAAWRRLAVPLRIIGDGPLAPLVREHSSPQIQYVGALPRDAVIAEMRRAAILVFPSVWYEGMPMTIIEAYSSGLPVMASDLGSMRELVLHGHTGLRFPADDSAALAAAVAEGLSDPARLREMQRNARRHYEARFTPEANYRQLMRVYALARDGMGEETSRSADKPAGAPADEHAAVH